jgi:hypothetical protein
LAITAVVVAIATSANRATSPIFRCWSIDGNQIGVRSIAVSDRPYRVVPLACRP